VARAIDIYEDYKLNVTALEALIISRVEHNLAKTVKPAEARKDARSAGRCCPPL